MKNVHLILSDLFLPQAFAAQVSADMALPFLEKLLARAIAIPVAARSIEAALCAKFGVSVQNDVPVAGIGATFDGLPAGIYLRADPVNLRLQRDQMLLSPVPITLDEAAQFCASLNEYFAGQGMTFFAPHPQRWYVRLEHLPIMQTMPLSGVLGSNVRGALPKGADAPRWHQVFNEIQMLLFAHPVNTAREERGDLTVNSVWLWGGGKTAECATKDFDVLSSDDVLGEMFAAAAGISHRTWSEPWQPGGDSQLLVYGGLTRALQSGDLQSWREALQALETHYAQPLWQALRSGKLERLQIEVLNGENSQNRVLTRADTWRFWRRGRPIAAYSLV